MDFVVAALGDVVPHLLHRLRRLIRRQIEQTERIRPTANLACISRARLTAACLADRGIILEAGAAVAFGAEFDAGEREVVAVCSGGAEGLAGFDGHARGVGVGGAGQGTWGDGVVGAAEVGPAGWGELANCWGVEGGGGGGGGGGLG